MNALIADWRLTLAMVGGVVAAMAIVAYAFFRPAVDLLEAERKRRLHLNHIGRIAEGQIVELVEHGYAQNQLLCASQAFGHLLALTIRRPSGLNERWTTTS